MGLWRYTSLSPDERIRASLGSGTPSLCTIALIAQESGTGKTTLAVHLAADLEGAGGSAAIVDLDPQAGAALWGDKRGRPPSVGAVPATARLCTLASLPFVVVLSHVPPRSQPDAPAQARVQQPGHRAYVEGSEYCRKEQA